MPSNRPPKYCRQRENGRADRAFVRLNSKKIKLGVYDSPESRVRYAELIAGTSVVPATADPSDDPSVSELLVQFLLWANGYYDSREYGRFTTVAKWLRRHAGSTPAKEFGPKRLKEIRQAMIEYG